MNLRDLPHIEYKQYGKSFLTEAILRVGYNEITSFEKLCPKLHAFFNGILNIKDSFEQQDTEINCVVVQNSDSTLSIEVTSSHIVFTMRPPAYGCFADLMDFVKTIGGVFNVMEIGNFQNVSICKKNVWALKSQKTQDKEALLSMIFSQSMLKPWMFEAAKDEATNECGQTCLFEGEGVELKIANGFKTNDEMTMFHLNLTVTENIPNSIGNMKDVMEKLNGILFDGFNWAISNKMIDVLKEQ